MMERSTVRPLRLAGRVALVTGAARGIGRGICLKLANEGARVVVNHLSHGEMAAAVVDEIVAGGGEAMTVRADISRREDAEALVAATVEAYGGLDILVNNAALTDVHKPWDQIDDDEWDDVMAVNLRGCFLCFRAAYPHLRAGGHGRVISISSVTFWLGTPRLVHYVASKGGVIGFTRSLAREVGVDGITVNAITPGAIQTEAELEVVPDQVAQAELMNELQSIKRRGQPEDIAGAVVFLASDESSFITGQTINVDGGWAMH
jgi:3-oxoacyl-[acyl-carrier protein] reductase